MEKIAGCALGVSVDLIGVSLSVLRGVREVCFEGCDVLVFSVVVIF